jgi:hypothetical protein
MCHRSLAACAIQDYAYFDDEGSDRSPELQTTELTLPSAPP